MRKAFSYLRFSTIEQAQGDTFRRQTSLAEAYAAKYNLFLDKSLTFHDLGVSAFRGVNSEQGALNDFKIAVHKGLVPKGSILLVESLDRISRQTAWAALQTLGEIANSGISIVTLSDEREYSDETFASDPMSLLMALLIFVRANEESETKSMRSRAAWSNKRNSAALKPMTARGPAWLRISEDRLSWLVIEERAAIVARIYALAARGMGERSIVKQLNHEGIAPWGNPGRRPGSIWNQSYIAKILRSHAVVGTLMPFHLAKVEGVTRRVPGAPINNYYPKVVGEEHWKAVRLLKTSINPSRGSNAGLPVQNVLGGIGRCSVCSRAMTRYHRRPTYAADTSVLVCVGSRTGTGCPSLRVGIDLIEKTILINISRLRSDAIDNGNVGQSLHHQIDQLRSKLKYVDHNINSLLLMMMEGIQDNVEQLLKKLSDDKKLLLRKIDKITDLSSYLENFPIENKLDSLARSLMFPPDRTTANLIMRQLFHSVIVDVASAKLQFNWKNGRGTELQYLPLTTSERRSLSAKSYFHRPKM